MKSLKTIFSALAIAFSTQANCFAGDQAYTPGPNSPIHSDPKSGVLLLTDLNGDGHLDLVSQHLTLKRIDVHLGDGKGGFTTAPAGTLSLDYMPEDMAVGDVNNDGKPDLCVTTRDDSAEWLYVYLGDGKGAFRGLDPVKISSSIDRYKPTIRLVDVDEDGVLDLITSNGRRNSIEILRGDGGGGFQMLRVIQLEGLQQFCFDVADTDTNGHPDIVYTSVNPSGDHPGTVTVLRGDGHGNFKPTGTSPTPSRTGIRTIADLNGDHLPDLVLGEGDGEGGLRFMLNDAHGHFTSTTTPLQFDRPVFDVVVADMNRAGRADLVAVTVSNRSSPWASAVAVMYATKPQASGQLAWEAAHGSPFPAGTGAYYIAIGDLNGDGKPDIVASSFEGTGVTVLLAR